MNKRLIALNIAILTLLIAPIIIQQVNAATANAYAYHPTCKLFGKVKKDWYIGRKWQEYKDDQGLSSFLPFNRTNENITISFANIVFDKNFVNKTIADATESGSTTEFTVTKEVLTSNGLEYIYIKMTNKTALSASTTYTVNEELLVSDEPAVDNNDYIFVTAKVKKTGDNIAQWQAYVIFYFLDSGATERKLYIKVAGQSGTDTWASGTDYVAYLDYDRDDTYVTWQFKIQDMLDAQSKTWQIVKLTKVRYVIELVTGDTLDATSVVEAYIRHAFIASGKIYIDDPFYENGLIVNGTSGQFTPSAGDIIQIYGANATKIVGVTIPFVYEDIRDFDEICTALAECYGFQYEWKFILPKSPETGDKLEYSNTNITLKCWFDGSFVDRLYVNGVFQFPYWDFSS